eukprot:scaffold8953_cov171-Amphora_coffeaeformis.AAC.6
MTIARVTAAAAFLKERGRENLLSFFPSPTTFLSLFVQQGVVYCQTKTTSHSTTMLRRMCCRGRANTPTTAGVVRSGGGKMPFPAVRVRGYTT